PRPCARNGGDAQPRPHSPRYSTSCAATRRSATPTMRAEAAWLRRGLGALLCVLALPAGAHNRSVSYSTWSVDGEVLQAQVRLPGVELNRANLHPQDPRILG